MTKKKKKCWENHIQHVKKVADKKQNHWARPKSCMVSPMWWTLDRAASQGLNSTQSSGRMTGSGPGRPSRPGNPSVALLLLEKAQRAATGHWGGWSPVSLPELRSFCPAPCFGAAALTPDRTSCSESEKQRGRKFTHPTLKHAVVNLKRHLNLGVEGLSVMTFLFKDYKFHFMYWL